MTVKVTVGLQPEWWTPDSQVGEAAPAQVLLSPIGPAEYINARYEFTTGAPGDAILRAVRACVRDWRNVESPDGKFDPRLLEQLPWNLLSEIAAECIRRGALSEAERKNS